MTSSSAELFDQAIAHQGAGRMAEALSVFDLLAARHPDVAEVQLGRGDVLMALNRFAEALAAFEARLISRNSAFDQFIDDLSAGHANESSAISPAAKNCARLFVGKAGCSDCHNGPLLSDESL